MKILVLDVGGTNVKILATGQETMRKIPSAPTLTPQKMVDEVVAAVKDWEFEAVTIGFPAPVIHGQVVLEPKNLGAGWVAFNFTAAFNRPVKLINDAAMQALGSYEGGRMLFMGLGTGLGTALIIDHMIAPLELAHLPYRKKKTYEDYLGIRGLQRIGRKKWQEAVEDVATRLRAALVAEYVVLGGGNSKKLLRLPPDCRLGDNRNAFIGGMRLWEMDETTQRQRYGGA